MTDGIYPFVLGGMQKHSFYMVKNMIERGVELTLLHSVEKNTPIPSKKEILTKMSIPDSKMFLFESYGFNFPSSYKYPGHYIVESYLLSKKMYKTIEANITSFDHVYAQGFMGWYMLNKLKRDSRSPIVWLNFHGFNMLQPVFGAKAYFESILFKPFVIWNIKRANKIISLGGKISEVLLNYVGKSKIEQIPIGIDRSWIADTINHIHARDDEFVFIGRDDKVKGLDVLYEVIQRLENQKLNLKVKIVGPIEENLNFNNFNYVKVSYLGRVDDEVVLMKIMDSAKCLILPSRSEGMPTVILEAMSRGVFVISSNVGVIEEMVDLNSSILIDPNNPDQLEKSIRSVLMFDSEQLEQCGLNSIKRVNDHYTWDKVIDQTIKRMKAF